MTEFFRLLLDYGALPPQAPNASIFDVAGYPHHENLCSNVMAFFLDPRREHGLRDTVLRCLLKCTGQPPAAQIGFAKVTRETATDTKKRLDIVIVTDNVVVGIENKIFHGLNNDLADYHAALSRLANNERPLVVGVVLSLWPIEASKLGQFVNVTYSQLWHVVKSEIGMELSSANSKWICYLSDLMRTTDALSGGGSMEITERDKFFIENFAAVQRLLDDRQSLMDRIALHVEKLEGSIAGQPPLPSFSERKIYKTNCIAQDFALSGRKVVFDLVADPRGWQLQIFGRNRASLSYAAKLIAPWASELRLEEDRYVAERWPLTLSLVEVEQRLNLWIERVVDRDAAQKVVTPHQT
ncbi:MAG TPA: PD-(D/E)XK nuclease family protein [Verrucomicrobiae bacterium]|nr:PD-(D/E)XK nuclease family protein [Verrucomicrobiae bacterium]